MCWTEPPTETGIVLNEVFAEGGSDEKDSGARLKTVVALGILLDSFSGRPSKPCAQNDESRRTSETMCWAVAVLAFHNISRLIEPDIIPKASELRK